jgi:hypothetical protein
VTLRLTTARYGSSYTLAEVDTGASGIEINARTYVR